MWEKICDFENCQRIRFELFFQEIPQQEEYDFFAFALLVRNLVLYKKELPSEHIFKVFIKKEAVMNNRDNAVSFLKKDPAINVLERAEQFTNEGFPFEMPDLLFKNGYAII